MATIFNDAAKARFVQRFPIIFNGGSIDIYGGPQPESPDLPANGPLLAQIVANGGVRFTVGGLWVSKDPTQPWLLNGLFTGEAVWWRMSAPGGGNTPRLDGAVYLLSDPKAGLLLPNLSISPLLERPVESFSFTM